MTDQGASILRDFSRPGSPIMRANLLVEKNKATLTKYEIPGSVFIRRR